MDEIARPVLLFLTQADDSLVAVDPKTIYLMRPDTRDTSGPLTRISTSIGPGQIISFEVRETVRQIGDALRAVGEGATISLSPPQEVTHG